MEEGRKSFKILTDKPIGKRPSERPRHRGEDNIRIHFKEIGVIMRNQLIWLRSGIIEESVNTPPNLWIP